MPFARNCAIRPSETQQKKPRDCERKSLGGAIHGFRAGALGRVIRVVLLPCFELLFGLFLGNAFQLLDSADKLVFLTGDHVQIVIGQLALLFLELALELEPVALQLIFVHH